MSVIDVVAFDVVVDCGVMRVIVCWFKLDYKCV
jgi:hypothetical protein